MGDHVVCQIGLVLLAAHVRVQSCPTTASMPTTLAPHCTIASTPTPSDCPFGPVTNLSSLVSASHSFSIGEPFSCSCRSETDISAHMLRTSGALSSSTRVTRAARDIVRTRAGAEGRLQTTRGGRELSGIPNKFMTKTRNQHRLYLRDRQNYLNGSVYAYQFASLLFQTNVTEWSWLDARLLIVVRSQRAC